MGLHGACRRRCILHFVELPKINLWYSLSLVNLNLLVFIICDRLFLASYCFLLSVWYVVFYCLLN